MSKVTASLKDTSKFYTELESGRYLWDSDEPESAGGTGKAPDPIAMTMGALAACTVMTLKMYLDQKKWLFADLQVSVESKVERIENAAPLSSVERARVINGRLRRIYKNILISGDFDDHQCERMLNIAAKCPVNRMLEQSSLILDKLEVRS